MRKSKRLSKKEIERRIAADEFKRLDFIRKKVGSFTHQGQLDLMLMGQEDIQKRKVLFDFIKPFIKFPNPHMPTSLETPDDEIIRVNPKLILPKQHVADDDERIIRV